MHDKFLEFVNTHPDYFEEIEGFKVLQRNIAGVFEDYARAVDPGEFQALARRMREIRHREQERLLADIAEWRKARNLEREKIAETEREEEVFRQKIAGIRARLIQLKATATPETSINRHWYHNGLVYACLASLGVLFLYVGLILQKKTFPGYIMAGIVCVIMGFSLQRSRSELSGFMDQSAPSRIKRLEAELTKLALVSKIRATAFLDKKKVATSTIDHLSMKIQSHRAKLEILDV